MNTHYGYDAYRSHDLSIAMKTSSGDTISMGFSNEKSASFSHTENTRGSSTSLSFSSMQSFSFSVETNGIDAQDKKEIEAFMKIAQPFIDDFLKELKEDAPKSPLTALAREIADIFAPMKEKDQNTKNYVKTNIVGMFDRGVEKLQIPDPKKDEESPLEKILKDAQKLLEKTLKEFDKVHKEIYA